MGKSRKQKRHFMDDNFGISKKIRKPMPKPSRAFKDRPEDRWDWREEIEDFRSRNEDLRSRNEIDETGNEDND